MMLKKAFMVRLAVERIQIVTAGTEHKVLSFFFLFFFLFQLNLFLPLIIYNF